MRKTKGEARRLPRGVKLLSIAAALVLTCVLAVSLIGTSFAADTVRLGTWTPVEGIELSVDAPSGEYDAKRGDKYSEWAESGSQATGNFALTGTVYSARQKSGGDTFDAKSRTLVIKNTNTAAVTLKFQWTERHTWFDTSSVTCDVEGFSTGTFNASIPAGESKSIVITSAGGTASGITNKDNPTQSITLSNFSVVQSDIYNLTLLPAERGTYSATNGTDKVNSSEKDETISYAPTSKKVTLTATAAAGYKFYLWEDEYHTPISTANPLTNYGPDSKGNSIRAVFVKSDMEASYHIGDANYYYWEDAMRVAAASTGETSVVVDNSKRSITLPASAADASRYAIGDCKYVAADAAGALTYVIPSGVKLVVPYSDKHDTAVDTVVNIQEKNPQTTIATTGSAYFALTVPETVTVNVNKGGTLLVNAIQGANGGSSYQAHIVGGSYGKMIVSGTIIVEGDFYARGYVIDENHTDAWDSATRTGRVYAKPGSAIYQLLQIRDWRGGTYTSLNASKVAPFTMYYLQNNMVETVYERGANMKAQIVVCTSKRTKIVFGNEVGIFGDAIQADPVDIISNGTGNDPSLFVMSDDATVTTRYDYAEDKLRVELNGSVSMNYLNINVGAYSVDTKKLVLAISDNLDVTVARDGKLTVNYGLKFLPGASLTVEEGAELEISSGQYASLYFYDAADYKDEWSHNQFRTHLDATGIVKNTGKVKPTGNAQLNLAGTLTVNGVLSFSQSNKTGLVPTGPNAKVIVNQLPTSTQKSIKEANAADNVATSANWQDPSGPMVNDGAVTAFKKATYKAAPAENGTYNWTRYTLNVNYVDAAGKAVTGLTPEKLYSIDGTASFQTPDGYAITGIKADASNSGLVIENATTVDDGKTKLANAVTDGCTDVKLSNITDGTITVTVKKYNHTVRWNFADAKSKDVTHTFMSYLASDEMQAVRAGIKGGVVDATGAVTIQTTEGAAFEGAGSSINTGKDPFEVTVTGINKDAVATVHYSASRSVTWNVTMDGKVMDVPKTEIKNGSEATYNLNQNGERWQVVEAKDITCTDSAVTVKDRDNTNDITVTGVYGDVTVNIAITTYAHKVSGTITTVNGDTTTSKTITPFFTNDPDYTPAPEGSGKYIVSQYRIDGGTLAGKAMQSVSTILPADAKVALTEKEVNIKLTFQSYVAVWRWNAAVTGAANVPADLSYTEYLTDKPDGQYEDPQNPGLFYPQYRTLRSNGTEGWYYANLLNNYGQAGIAYAIPEGRRYVLSDERTAPVLRSDRGSTKANGWYYDDFSQSGNIWSLEFDGILPTLNEDMPSAIVTVNLVPYAYDVTFVDQKGAVLEKFCAAENGKNAADGEDINFCVEGNTKRFAKAYKITTDKGSPAINGVAGLKQDEVAIPLDPWNSGRLDCGCTLTGVEADTTVELTLDSYERIAIWKWTVGDETEQQVTFLQSHQNNTAVSCYQVETIPFTKWTSWAYKAFSESATAGYCPQFTIPAGEHYYISDAYFNDKIGADAKSCESEPDTSTNNFVKTYSFTLVPYDASLIWSVDGGVKQYTYISGSDAVYVNHESSQPTNKPAQDTHYNAANRTWTYYPADGRLIKSVDSHNCTVRPAADKLSLAVTDLQANSTVNIVTQMPTTALEGYYMGDMSFEWVRNAAVYTFDADGKTASWKPVDSFAWRHAAGSRSFTVTEDDTITVANGSIYFINSTSAAKTYTIKLERTDGAAESALKLVVNGEEFPAAGDTVTIPAHTSQTVVCTLSGTPTESELTAGEIGHITVTEGNG